MDVRVAGAADLPALRAGAAAPVVVLEHPGAEALVERSHGLPGLPACGRAEEREHRDRERLAVVSPHPLGGLRGQIREAAVADVDLRLVRDRVRDRPDEAELRIGLQVRE